MRRGASWGKEGEDSEEFQVRRGSKNFKNFYGRGIHGRGEGRKFSAG